MAPSKIPPADVLSLIISHCSIDDYFTLTQVHPSFRSPVYSNITNPLPPSIPFALAVHILNNQNRGSFAPSYTYEKFFCGILPVLDDPEEEVEEKSGETELDLLLHWKEAEEWKIEEWRQRPKWRVMRGSWERHKERISKKLRDQRRVMRGYGGGRGLAVQG